MAVFSIIKKSQLEGAHRLDAEYYQPEYLSIRSKLFACPILEDISKKITDFGAYSQMNFVEYTGSGVRFFRNQDIGESFIEDNEPIYISNDTYKKLSLKLEEYDILTPRVGTIGTAAVVFEEYLPASANQNLAQIKPDIDKINPIYLSVFLNSKFGHLQFDQFATGNVQPWLNLSQIKSIKVYVPSKDFQESVKNLALQSLEKRNNSKSLYVQAENLLLEELGLKDFENEEDLYSVVNFSDIKENKRMDPDYFQPKYERLLKAIRKNSKTISEIAIRSKKRIEINPEKEYKYIEISDVNVSNGEVFNNPIKGKELPANAKIKICGGELLVSKVRPTRGAIAIIPEDFKKDYIASGAFSVFDAESPMREYLQIILRSFIGKLQMERPTTGTSYPTITDEDVEKLMIPILPTAIQQKIADLVKGSHEARKKAKELLEEAKKRVEDLIENKK